MPRRANSTNPTGHVWTETRMLKLCVLVIQQTKCQPSALAELWAEAYPDEQFQPTPKAITHKIAQMKSSAEVKGPDGAKSTPRKGTTTPQKRNTPKDFDGGSPSKHSKKSDAFSFEEEDDEEDDDELKYALIEREFD